MSTNNKKSVLGLVNKFETTTPLFKNQLLRKPGSDCSISINICLHKEDEKEEEVSNSVPLSPEAIYDVPTRLHVPKNCKCLTKSKSLEELCSTCHYTNIKPPVPAKIKTNKNSSKVTNKNFEENSFTISVKTPENKISEIPEYSNCDISTTHKSIDFTAIQNTLNNLLVQDCKDTNKRNVCKQLREENCNSFDDEKVYDDPVRLKTTSCYKKYQQKINNKYINSALRNIIDELILTEKSYVCSLKKIIYDYQRYFRQVTAPVIGKEEIFGNVEEIYTENKAFLDSLTRCNYDYDQIAKIFIFFENILFVLYPCYCKNKPLADRALSLDSQGVIKARQRDLGDQLNLNSYLLMPIQRLGKYILLLEAMIKELEKNNEHSENLLLARDIVRDYMSRGNTYLELEDIENFPFDLSFTGHFIIKENFWVMKGKNKIQQTFFLFEHFIVIGKYHAEREKYACAEHLETNRVNITTGDCNLPSFSLNYYTEDGDVKTYKVCAISKKSKITWLNELEKILWKQLQQQKELKLSTLKREYNTL